MSVKSECIVNARIVNLRTIRKRKAREADPMAADRNAVEHGRTKAERRLTEAENARVSEIFKGKRLDAPDNDD